MYEIELLATGAAATIFALIALQAKNLIMEIVYKFAALFAMLALVGTASVAASVYGLSNSVLIAIFFTLIVVLVLEVLFTILQIFRPDLFTVVHKKFHTFGGD